MKVAATGVSPPRPPARGAALALGLCAGLVHGVGAVEMPFPPTRSAVCNEQTGFVNKEALATYLLTKYPVSAVAMLRTPAAAGSSRQFLAASLANPATYCEKGCAASDAGNLTSIKGSMTMLLEGTQAPVFVPTTKVEPTAYFAGSPDENAIRCSATGEAPGARLVEVPAETSPLRVRGNPSQLNIDRSQKQLFAATDKAKVGFTNDSIKDAETTQIVGYVGWALPMATLEGGDRFEVVPYAGLNRQVVKVSPTSTTKATIASTYEAGALLSFYTTSMVGPEVLGHEITARPAFLANTQSGSRLASLTAQYIPVYNPGAINAFAPLSTWAYGEIILSAIATGGAYIDRGIPSVAGGNANYVRLGGRAGFAVLSDVPTVPLDWVLTFTSLGAVTGGPSIDYFQTSLNLNLDAQKFFGITVSYSDGRNPDTTIKERVFGVNLSGRF